MYLKTANHPNPRLRKKRKLRQNLYPHHLRKKMSGKGGRKSNSKWVFCFHLNFLVNIMCKVEAGLRFNVLVCGTPCRDIVTTRTHSLFTFDLQSPRFCRRHCWSLMQCLKSTVGLNSVRDFFCAAFLICCAIAIIIQPWGLPYWFSLYWSETWLRLLWDQILSCGWIIPAGVRLFSQIYN